MVRVVHFTSGCCGSCPFTTAAAGVVTAAAAVATGGEADGEADGESDGEAGGDAGVAGYLLRDAYLGDVVPLPLLLCTCAVVPLPLLPPALLPLLHGCGGSDTVSRELRSGIISSALPPPVEPVSSPRRIARSTVPICGDSEFSAREPDSSSINVTNDTRSLMSRKP
uniref:Uncharacterized protein n=1 Tax=Lygus hesperus TaxID=30085 RepID=A0A0A9WG92_LYGHE